MFDFVFVVVGLSTMVAGLLLFGHGCIEWWVKNVR